MDKLFDTPIAFLIFKRPDETKRVFEMIKKIKPKRLLIVADGARNDNEKILCERTRSVVENIDWPCEVLKNYSDTNLGCKKRIATGLTWVFKNVDKAVILEDDCLPSISFFKFCEELLIKYKDNEKIMHISGINVARNGTEESVKNLDSIQDTQTEQDYSYHFSKIAQIWGWATWSRAWQKYDVNMPDWPEIRDGQKLKKVLMDDLTVDYFKYLFEKMYGGILDTWDVAWTYTCMKEDGLCIVPNRNLVQNIGFGDGATHSIANKGYVGKMINEEMHFPLTHPKSIGTDVVADRFVFKKVFGIGSSYKQKVIFFIKSNFPFIHKSIKKLLRKLK